MARGNLGNIPEQATITSTAALGPMTYISVGGAETFDLASLTTSTPYGFADQNDAEGFVQTLIAMQTRMVEIEAQLQALGLLDN